jgi:hypothetical protein
MNSARLFSILAVIIAAAVLLAVLILQKEPPSSLQSESPHSTPVSSNTQPDMSLERKSLGPELQVTHALSREDVVPLYTALQKRVDEYQTIHVRTRLEFPKAMKDQILETEFWFDAIRPHEFIHKAIKSVPEDRKSMTSRFVPVPFQTEIYDGTHLTVVSHLKRTIHKLVLSATDVASRPIVAPMKVLCATRMANPLQDLLFGLPYEERLKEMVEAKVVNTSSGHETQVMFRINGEMSRVIQHGKLLISLPVSHEGLKMMALRRDIFDTETGDLKQSVYLDSEWKPFLVQTYPEVEWNGVIPKDRFLPDAPPGSVTHDVLEHQRRIHQLAITSKDLEEYQKAGNPISASSILDLKRQREREKGLEPSN